MKINIVNLLKTDNSEIELNFNEKIEGLDNIYGDCEFSEPAEFKGNLSNLDGVLYLKGRIKAQYSVKCSRCLKEMHKIVETIVDEKFLNSDNKDDIEAYTYQENTVDITKALKDNIILALPVRQLCSEECKGLCPKCGANLNTQVCGCREEDVDSRLEVLKNFFNKN